MPSTDERPVVLYLIVPPTLKLLLKQRAKQNDRSVNAECRIILTQAVKDGYRIF